MRVYEIKILEGESYRGGENGNEQKRTKHAPNFNQCRFCGSFVS